MHTVKQDTYFIAHNGKDIFHYGFCEEGTNLDTGQPILEVFSTKELRDNRYFELTGKEIVDNV